MNRESEGKRGKYWLPIHSDTQLLFTKYALFGYFPNLCFAPPHLRSCFKLFLHNCRHPNCNKITQTKTFCAFWIDRHRRGSRKCRSTKLHAFPSFQASLIKLKLKRIGTQWWGNCWNNKSNELSWCKKGEPCVQIPFDHEAHRVTLVQLLSFNLTYLGARQRMPLWVPWRMVE